MTTIQNLDKTENISIIHDTHKNNYIAALLMVKNESLRIHVTLESLLGFIHTVIIFDTGSTDDTISIITNFCNKYKLTLYIHFGTFVDFSTSRNEALDFADTIQNINYLLLLDCNDELKNGTELLKFCKDYNGPESAFLLKQSWRSNIIINYFNVRLIKSKSGWRYKGVVHEYICNNNIRPTIRLHDIVIYQDRTKDDNKSFLRFSKDKELLTKEYETNKTGRTVYYLAQTYECLHDLKIATKFYKERMTMDEYYEEKYQAAYHVGMLYKELGKPFEKYSGYFLFALGVMHRSEPLVRIAEYYISIQEWIQAFYYLNEACKIDIPECGLFVDVELYNYYRWHLMGIVAFYVKEYKIGLYACEKAIKVRNNDIDKHNLIFYKNELNCVDEHIKLSLL